MLQNPAFSHVFLSLRAEGLGLLASGAWLCTGTTPSITGFSSSLSWIYPYFRFGAINECFSKESAAKTQGEHVFGIHL